MPAETVLIHTRLLKLHSRAFRLKFILLPVVTLALISAALTSVFQCYSIRAYCVSKLSVVFFGDVVFWSFAAYPLIKMGTRLKQQSFAIPKTAGAGIVTLAVNQLFIYQLINLVFQYGFGCSDYTQSLYALFIENNLVSNIFLFLFFTGIGFVKGSKLASTTEPAVNAKAIDNEAQLRNYPTTLPVKTGAVTTKVQLNEVLYIEADNNTITLVTHSRKFVLYRSLTSLEKELDPYHFIRIHRSTVLNKNFVQKIHHLPNGDGTVELKNGATLRISRHYKTKSAVLV